MKEVKKSCGMGWGDGDDEQQVKRTREREEEFGSFCWGGGPVVSVVCVWPEPEPEWIPGPKGGRGEKGVSVD